MERNSERNSGKASVVAVKLAIARRRGRKHLLAGGDQALEVGLAAAQRPQHDPGVAHQPAHAVLLGVQGGDDGGELVGGHAGVGDRVRQVLAAPIQGAREIVEEALERAPGGLVERAEHLVEPLGLADLPDGQRRALLQLRRRPRSVGELDEGLAQQRLGAQNRPRVAGEGRAY